MWVPSHQDWLITTEFGGNRVKVINVRTGAMICKFGQFHGPWGVAITSDSSLVIVGDCYNALLGSWD